MAWEKQNWRRYLCFVGDGSRERKDLTGFYAIELGIRLGVGRAVRESASNYSLLVLGRAALVSAGGVLLVLGSGVNQKVMGGR